MTSQEKRLEALSQNQTDITNTITIDNNLAVSIKRDIRRMIITDVPKSKVRELRGKIEHNMLILEKYIEDLRELEYIIEGNLKDPIKGIREYNRKKSKET